MKRFIFALYLYLSCSGLALAQPQLSGDLSGNLGPGTYLVVGDIQVPAGQTLTIAPGTTFLHNGYRWWRIYGTLNAVGAASDSIKWLRQNPMPEHRWAGFQFVQGAPSGSIFSYCVIEYGYKPESVYPDKGGAIYTVNVPLTITHSRLSFNNAKGGGGGIYAFGTDGMVITHNLICDNYTSGGIFLHGCSNSEVSYNVVARNTSTGT
jgi:hypothetical protein